MVNESPAATYADEIQRMWAELPAAQLEQALRERMERAAATIGTATPEFAAYANELGTLYRVTARYAEGETAFKQALSSIEAQEGRSAHYATCLDNLAELYRLAGRLDECERALACADGLFEAAGACETDEYAACMNYQGHAKMARGAYAEAAERYARALAITRAHQRGTIDEATAFQNVANAYLMAGDPGAASGYLEQALAVYDEYGLRVNAHYVGLLNTLGTLAARQGDTAAATDWFTRAVDATGKCKMNPDDVAVVLKNARAVLGPKM